MLEETPLTTPAQPAPRNVWVSGPVAREPEPRPGAIAVRRILTAVRRHIVLTLAVTTCATTVAFIMFREPANFQAQAVLRLVGERQAVAPDLDPSPDLDVRHVVLVNSLVPRVRSRGIIGAVVDSMGLQVRPVPVFSLLHPASQPDLGLTGIHVRPDVKADTVTLQFAEDYLTVRHADSSARQAYGRPINAGGAMFIVPKAPDVAGAVLAIDPRDVAIDRVLLQLSVVPLINTDALNVRYIDSDPRRAMDITNGVVRNFYASTINSSQEMGRRRRLFLQAQLQEAEQQYSQAQAGLTAFRSRQRLASSSDKLARQQADLMTLDTRRGDLEADRAVFRSLVSRLDAAKDSASREQLDAMAFAPEIATDAVVGKMFQQLQTYRSRLDSLTSGPYPSSATNPDVLQLQQMVTSSERELVRAARGRLTSIDERLAALQDLRTRNADAIAGLPTLQAEEARLEQKISALGDFTNQLRLEYQKARMAEALAAADIEIVDYAALPYLPTGIPWWVMVGLALAFGLIVGTLLSLFLEMKNRSIRAPEELEEVLHLRGLGVIPPVMEAIAEKEARALGRPSGPNGAVLKPAMPGVVIDSPACPSVGAEAFRLLYSTLTFGWAGRQRTILVTSVAPQEGKTLVAANLAVTFAREGARVLLIDCDLRRPRLHKLFQVGRSPGLVELLRPKPEPEEPVEVMGPRPLQHAYSMTPDFARGSDPAAANGEEKSQTAVNGGGRPQVAAAPRVQAPRYRNIRETSNPGLWLLPCGAVEGSIAETLKAGPFRALLADLAGDYDVIILDTSPTRVSADAVILAPVADDVLLVVRAGYTDRDAAERAQQQLDQAGGNVVGAVLNDPEGKIANGSSLYYPYGYPVTSD